VEGGRGACRVKFTEAAYGLACGQRLHRHAAVLELLDRVGIGAHAPVGAGADDQVGRELVQDLGKVVGHQGVAVVSPPVPHHPVGQDDQVPGLLASVDDDLSELVVVDPRHRSAPETGRLAAPRLIG
jgi:hypothetical protein